MKVLILDDQYEKTKIFVNTFNEIGAFEIQTVTNSKDALNFLTRNQCDILVLDLKVPDYLGADINPKGGVEFLDFLEQNERYCKPTHILAATSHKDAYDEFEKYFSDRGWKLFYSPESSDELRTILETMALHSPGGNSSYDVVILTALDHTEQEAVLKMPCSWEPCNVVNDSNNYYKGKVRTTSGKMVSVIAACCTRMGIAAAACAATKLILRHNPKYIIMTGICAGIKNKTNLGDIIVADPSWDWGSGKLTVKDGAPHFMSAPHQLPLKQTHRQNLKSIALQRTYLDDIYSNARSFGIGHPPHALNLRVGPMASGAVVLEDPATVGLIVAQHRETLAIEMEAYGVMAGAEYAFGGKQTESIVIKSVCDFADPNKNDEWQGYAAYTSAAFAFKLIECELFKD